MTTAAEAVFGPRLALAERYAELLTTQATMRGLIGPREHERIWDRHLLNSAVVAELLPQGARVVDVGSGAGLPGLALACARPDLILDLVEPLERRCDFLKIAISELGLGEAVQVFRGRAEEPEIRRQVGSADWVTARALAPLDRLVGWCIPLLRPGGALLALKGTRAADEVAAMGPRLNRSDVNEVQVVLCGVAVLSEPTRVVRLRRSTLTPRRSDGGESS